VPAAARREVLAHVFHLPIQQRPVHQAPGQKGLMGGGGATGHAREPEQLLDPLEEPFNGLVTNDTVCLSRFGQLNLTWWRSPLRLRGRHSDLQTASLGEVAHRGGSHETAVVPSPADVRPPRRAATLGPRVSGDPGVGGHW